MSQDKVNSEALPKYINHAQVFKASQEIAAKIAIPSQVTMLQGREKEVVELGTDYEGFKDYLLGTL